LHSYKPSTTAFNEKVAVKTIEPEHEAFILKQTKCNFECKVNFYCFVKTKTILKDGKPSTPQKMRCLVEEEDVDKRDNFFKTKRNKQKERMRQRHLLRRQEVTPRRVRLVTHILDTLKKVNV